MAAPSTTALQTPAGIMLHDGFRARIAFNRDPDASLWVKTIKMPDIDGGDAIDFNTMHNTLYRMFRERSLITITDITGTCAYDPNVWNNIITNLVNQNGAITIHLDDGSTLDVWGFLRTFSPQEFVEGTFPTANFAITVSNFDPQNRVEAGPVLTSVAGT